MATTGNKTKRVLAEASGLASVSVSAPRRPKADAGGSALPAIEDRSRPVQSGLAAASHAGASSTGRTGTDVPSEVPAGAVTGPSREPAPSLLLPATSRASVPRPAPAQARAPVPAPKQAPGQVRTGRGDGTATSTAVRAALISAPAHSGATGCTDEALPDAGTGHGFRVDQVRALKSRLKAAHIRERRIGDRVLPYVEGWHVIAEANRIFGHHGWDRQTLSCQMVHASQNRDGYRVVYIAQVRVTADACGKPVIREGIGTGEAFEAEPGAAHERAAKGAETDAMKRALMTFGHPFGLGLYTGMVTRKRTGP